MRMRNVYLVLYTILVAVLWVISDPDAGFIQELPFGAGLIAQLVIMSKGILAACLLFITYKAMMDYKIADFENLGIMASETAQGAGLYAIAVAIRTLAFAVVILGAFLA